MATYEATYITRRGRRRVERMDAVDPSMVRQTLLAQGCWISSIKLHTARRYRHDKIKVSRKQLLMALQALKLLIKSGAKIDRAIRVAVEQTPPGKLRYVLTTIAEGTEGGDFAASFEQFKQVFPETVVEILKANQTAGDLENGLSKVCDYYHRLEEIRGNVMKGLFVPAIGFIAFLVAFAVIFGFTIPSYKKVFVEIMPESEMPLLTRVFFHISGFVVAHPTFVILAFFGSIVGIWHGLKLPSVQALFVRIAKKVPLVGPAMMATALAKLSYTYADLTRAGFKTIMVLDVCSRVVGHIEVSRALLRIRASILKNASVGESFAKENKVLPPEFITAVSIGENDLLMIFETLGEHYAQESKSRIDMAIAALEPAMAAMLGVFALMAGAAIILPVTALVQKLGGH
jgi:type II secretory pathway component PulF